MQQCWRWKNLKSKVRFATLHRHRRFLKVTNVNNICRLDFKIFEPAAQPWQHASLIWCAEIFQEYVSWSTFYFCFFLSDFVFFFFFFAASSGFSASSSLTSLINLWKQNYMLYVVQIWWWWCCVTWYESYWKMIQDPPQNSSLHSSHTLISFSLTPPLLALGGMITMYGSTPPLAARSLASSFLVASLSLSSSTSLENNLLSLKLWRQCAF